MYEINVWILCLHMNKILKVVIIIIKANPYSLNVIILLPLDKLYNRKYKLL